MIQVPRPLYRSLIPEQMRTGEYFGLEVIYMHLIDLYTGRTLWTMVWLITV